MTFPDNLYINFFIFYHSKEIICFIFNVTTSFSWLALQPWKLHLLGLFNIQFMTCLGRTAQYLGLLNIQVCSIFRSAQYSGLLNIWVCSIFGSGQHLDPTNILYCSIFGSTQCLSLLNIVYFSIFASAHYWGLINIPVCSILGLLNN